MGDHDYRLPGPAEIVASCREWDAGRRRWPERRYSDSFGTFLETLHQRDAARERRRVRVVRDPRNAADLAHLGVAVAAVLGIWLLGFLLGRWMR